MQTPAAPHPRATTAGCPGCEEISARPHSHYTRTLTDLSWQDRRVVIAVQTRRWHCPQPHFPRRVFAERVAGVAQAGVRRTHRLGDLQNHLGLALGGEAGARLTGRLGLPISPDTLLRLVRGRAPAQVERAPRVLGIDDWAWRRGQRYGTILCDLERGQVIDLLPDREAATVADWLQRHPGVEVVARDRAGAYDGVRRGAPGAVQVADRWHLPCNGSQALAQMLDRHRGEFSRVARTIMSRAAAEALPVEPCPVADREARFQRVAALAQDGQGIRAIVRETGLTRNTVRHWLRAGTAPTWCRGERARITDPFVPYLMRRLDEGERKASRLWRELQASGFRGGVMSVRLCVAALRVGPPRTRPAPGPVWARPSPRRAARLLLTSDDHSELDGRFLDALVAAVPEIERAIAEVKAFTVIVREQ